MSGRVAVCVAVALELRTGLGTGGNGVLRIDTTAPAGGATVLPNLIELALVVLNRVSATKQTLRARAMICAVLRARAMSCDMFVPPPEEQHSSQITAHAHAHTHARAHAHAPITHRGSLGIRARGADDFRVGGGRLTPQHMLSVCLDMPNRKRVTPSLSDSSC